MENEILTSDLNLKGHRTLATVVFTDCVGFSARMSVDEEHTLDLIRRDLKLMKSICEQFEGRVLKTTGDGLLMCFSSAVKAVECAIAIQQTIAKASANLTPNDALIHRIGIHLADMYITERDVMGNGVNIAARLQTEADPGGICISQTVYDVAKHGLQLEAEYLGPRELKNIREVVPAYKILLESDRAQDAAFTEAIRHLEQSPNFSRIRKLIHYVCRNRWENDDNQLSRLSFRGLLQEFLGLGPTPDHLKTLLHNAVSTLSKQMEYSLVANEILALATRLYTSESSTNPGQSPTDDRTAAELPRAAVQLTTHLQHLYADIAQQLDQHSDCLRIKKLLFYVCKHHWEGDIQRLNASPTASLVHEIHSLAPTPQQLQALVDKFVQTLNKQAEYSLVANILLGKLAGLYQPEPQAGEVGQPKAGVTAPKPNAKVEAAQVEQVQPYHAIATVLEQHPENLRFKKLIIYVCHNQWISDPAQLSTFSTSILLKELHTLAPSQERLHLVLKAAIKTLSKPAEYFAVASGLVRNLHPLYQPASAAAQPAPAVLPKDHAANGPVDEPASQPEVDTSESSEKATPAISLFDARLGILKYTNPLKAKILAFSALHSDFDFSDQDWLQLKTNELDGLLRGLLTTCKNYTDLEHLLYSTAKRLRQPDELVQTAETVVKCLRIFYLHGRPPLLVNTSGEETKISLDEFEESTQGITTLKDEYEHTRQLAPALPTIDNVVGLPVDAAADHTGLLPAHDQELASGE